MKGWPITRTLDFEVLVQISQRECPCSWGGAESLSEHFDECAGLLVADSRGNLFDRVAFDQEFDRLHQSHLSSPCTEGHFDLALKNPFHGSNTCPCKLAERAQRSRLGLVRDQGFDYTECPGVGGHSYEDGKCRGDVQLRDDEIAKSAVQRGAGTKLPDTDRFENQLAQEGRDV